MEEIISLDALLEIINNKQVAKLRELFETSEIIDIAEVCDEIEDISKLLFIFKTVKSEYTAELFTYLNEDSQAKLINLFSDKQLTELITNSYTDDIVDFLEDLPANLVTRVLKASPKEERNDINKLLNYKEDTAGSIMTTEYVEISSDLTVKEALAQIKKVGQDAETISSTFVIDKKRNLVGVLYLDLLVLTDEDTPIKDIMNEEFHTANVHDDQEAVAETFKRYDLTVLPVLNNEHRLIGIITIDDVIDVMEKETSEDIAIQAGMQPLEDEYLKTGVFTLAKKRIVWLLFLMVSATFTSMIISRFEDSLKAAAVLSAFIPMFMDTGGNSGGQTTSLITRGLATKEVTTKDYGKVIWKELRVALVTGLVVATFNFLWIFLELTIGLVSNSGTIPNWQVAGLVALTLFSTIIIAKCLGASLPMFAQKIGLDPALMSGPIVTTLVDATSLLIYFLLCTQIFRLV
ncbi:MAG: magnesium transporter [Erysipelotrichales bacterium]|nr:magnesium transporter [Erysipelotrichales bacterium]